MDTPLTKEIHGLRSGGMSNKKVSNRETTSRTEKRR
jgi:hypothetical protein